MDTLKQNSVCEYTLKDQLIVKGFLGKLTIFKNWILFSIILLNITLKQISLLHYSLFSVKEKSLLHVLLPHKDMPLIARFIMKQENIKVVNYLIISISII